MALDSKAAFKERLRALGLGDYHQKFVDNEWDTMALFAYASGYVPGHSSDQIRSHFGSSHFGSGSSWASCFVVVLA